MELNRKPFQGVFNIIRFNWHFYLAAVLAIFSLLVFHSLFPHNLQPFLLWLAVTALVLVAISLIISFYVYDLSELYRLNWLPELDNKIVLNINAGFDETTEIIKIKTPSLTLTICDFYDPNQHTEKSIKRARRAYPPVEGTIPVTTDKLPFPANSFDYLLAILSVHEIRDEKERSRFFKELNRVTKEKGQILVTEHLRDLNNFLAYTIGFFHFHSKASWLRTFEQANLTVRQEIKTTPFITTFVLEKNGDTF